MRASVAAIVAAPAISVAQGAVAQELPKGWRFPTKNEIAGDELRKNSPTGFTRVVADLNGDGVEDEAFILKSIRFSGEGLWVHLSHGSQFSWVKLDEIRWGKEYPNVDLAMGVDMVKPGVIPYACFDEANDCDFGDDAGRPKLKLKDPALIYFKIESAASIYFWSTSHKRFMRVWVSD